MLCVLIRRPVHGAYQKVEGQKLIVPAVKVLFLVLNISESRRSETSYSFIVIKRLVLYISECRRPETKYSLLVP